jgi:hypothetical protein
MMNTDALYLIVVLLLATALIHYMRRFYHLTGWLKQHAEMTWETYKRLALAGCNCTGDCRQGRDCPKR